PAASVDVHHLEPRRLSRPDGAEGGHAAAVPARLNPRGADAPRPGRSLPWCATTAATSRRSELFVQNLFDREGAADGKVLLPKASFRYGPLHRIRIVLHELARELRTEAWTLPE